MAWVVQWGAGWGWLAGNWTGLAMFGRLPGLRPLLLVTSPLFLARRSPRQVQACRFIDQRAFGGLTALHFAVVTGSLDAVQALLRAGASIMVKSGAFEVEADGEGLRWEAGRACAAGTRAAAGQRACLLALVAPPLLTHSRPAPCRPADGEAYIGEDFLVPGSTPLHVAVIISNVSIVHAILQARRG